MRSSPFWATMPIDGSEGIVAVLALAMFVTLFVFGQRWFGWDDPGGHVQLALFGAFVFGVICGFRVKD